LEVLYRERRRGEAVFVCRMLDGTNAAVPAWMFDRSACSRMRAGAPQVELRALFELRSLLGELRCDRGTRAEGCRRSEVPDDKQSLYTRSVSPEAEVPTIPDRTGDGGQGGPPSVRSGGGARGPAPQRRKGKGAKGGRK
jgi:hypothetical protein